MKMFLSRDKRLLSMTLLLTLFFLSACGITGKTSRFVLPIDLSDNLHITSEIRVASANMDKEAARLTTVGTQKWGKFDADDLQNIEQSLRETLAALSPATYPQPVSKIDIHLMIRRYFVSHSNTGGAVIVCVVWAATNSKGKIIFNEQFYASKVIYLIGTVGFIKDYVHKAIVLRIATKSLHLASGNKVISGENMTFKDTYDFFEEAVSYLPPVMFSTTMTEPIESEIIWDEAKPQDEFNWNNYLSELYKIE